MDDLRQLESLKSRRSVWEAHWQEIAEYMLPAKADFLVRRYPGSKKMEKVYDSIGIWASEQAAAGLSSLLTPASLPWYRPSADTDQAGLRWLDESQDIVMEAFNTPSNNFYSAAYELYLQLVCFGTAPMSIPEGPRFKTHFLGEAYLEEGPGGTINTIYRVFKMERGAVEDQFKIILPGSSSEEVEVVHLTKPGLARFGRRFVSIYWVNGKVVERKGFDQFPFVIPRFSKNAAEIYGRSPAMTALPDVKMVNAMVKTSLDAAQKIVSPPLQMPDDGFIMPIRTSPNAINYYRPGTSEIKPISMGNRPDIGMEVIGDLKKSIARTFFADLLNLPGQSLPGGQNAYMTATEVLARRQEMMRLLAPVVTRLQHEFLGPLLRRVYHLVELPPVPPSLSEMKIDFISPLAQSQKEAKADGLTKFLQIVGPFAQADPSVMLAVNGSALGPWVADLVGLSASVRRTPDQIAQLLAQKDAAAQQAQAAQTGVNETLALQQAAKAQALQ